MDSTQNISQPPLQSLAIDLDRNGFCYLIYGNADYQQPSAGRIDLKDNGNGLFKALENAIYDNSFLLDDYRRVTVSLHAQHFVVMPLEFGERKDAEQVFNASFSSLEGELLTCPAGATDAVIACDVPSGVVSFLKRTFSAPTLLHHLSPLCRYCSKAYADENGCVHINVQQGEAHVVATRNGSLQLANTLQYREMSDLVYYALSVWKHCGMSNATDKILVTGDNELRKDLSQQLRQWVKYAMPEVLPAKALRLGQNAVDLPFNLILLALYENN